MDELLTTDACTLPTAERPLRVAEFEDLFSASARSVTRDEDSVHIHLEGDSSLREQVRDLVERENACCSFFAFALNGSSSSVTLDIAVPVERRDILNALADRAEALSPTR